MGMKEKAALLFEKTGRLRRGEAPAGSKLPENTWFLDDSAIACFPRKRGDSRYFYGTDGFYLWAYQSGYISVNESTFTVFPYADEGKQPYLAFFGGIKDGKGGYLPVSLTGVAAQPRERAERCTVFTPTAAYYLTEAEGLRFAVRIYADEKKRVRATLSAQNLTGTDKEIYLSSYLNCLLRYNRHVRPRGFLRRKNGIAQLRRTPFHGLLCRRKKDVRIFGYGGRRRDHTVPSARKRIL